VARLRLDDRSPYDEVRPDPLGRGTRDDDALLGVLDAKCLHPGARQHRRRRDEANGDERGREDR